MTEFAAPPLIEIRGASRYYAVGGETIKAVDRVDWRTEAARYVALRGRSGSGKTTLLNLIGGLDAPTQGDVFLRGKRFSGLSERELTSLRRHNYGFVFQSFALLPVLSAFENVELALRIAGAPARDRSARASEVLEAVGLGDRMEHRPFQLSGGEQQRVAIARALANRPALIIADEPTGELDSVTGLAIAELFGRVVRDEGITVVMSTHDPALSQFVDETYLMQDGRLSRVEGALDLDMDEFDSSSHLSVE